VTQTKYDGRIIQMTPEHTESTPKIEQLAENKNQNRDETMTHDSGAPVVDTEQTLRAGRRGPTLLNDPDFYRKQSHFNRERIPEKVVHARGFGVHGEFELHTSLQDVTKAHFLSEPGTKTPTFVRFSTFNGSRGSKDTAI
jgi:catalase